MYHAIYPGKVWLDTEGKRIQAHGGSVIYVDGTYYWYGENKEFTTGEDDIWTWGVRCYASKDLYNWEDKGLIIQPVLDNKASSLCPTTAMLDRLHIIYNKETKKYVCWMKIMNTDGTQTETVMTADDILGPYELVCEGLKPLGMSAGDFDLAVAPDGKAYYYFERVHSETICADLTPDYTDVTGYYSTHFPHVSPPDVREATAHFYRKGKHYLVTSGTTGYLPNPSEVAIADTWHEVHRIGENLAEGGLRSMEAGMDVEMQNCLAFNEELKEKFRIGEADMTVLDTAVLRILEAKFRMGLFEHPYALDGEDLVKTFWDKEDEMVSLQSALESCVLLKNDGVLPFDKTVKKIAVVGCHARNARSFFGGYTHLSMVEAVHAVANFIAGLESGNIDGRQMKTVPGTQIQSDETAEFDAILKHQKPNCRSLFEELQAKLPDAEVQYAYGYAIAGDDCSHFEEALELVKSADLVIMTLGGKHGSCSVASMGEGVDGTDINLPFCQDEFIRRAAKLGKPMIGIHFNGRPISSDVADKYLHAIIEAWNPSEKGAEALVKILLGEYNPGGKLPVTVARSAGQLPIYYNHVNGSAWHQGGSIGFANYVDMLHTPRYYFGHGLSYTEFEYSDLKIDKKEIMPSEELCMEVTVENVGKMDGDEVVQVYVCDLCASMARPVKELVGFKRIFLKAGEKKKVRFTMQASQMAFLNLDMNWRVEKGEFEVQIGSSSEDIRLKDRYQVLEDAVVEGRTRGFYAKAEIIIS